MMEENQLRKYWSAYTDAWKLMKNRQMVEPEHVARMIKKNENPVMNRVFCLVVWQEIKRIKSGGTPLLDKEYEECLTGAWKLFKQHSCPNATEEYWNGLVDMIRSMSKQYDNCSFISNLLIHVTLEELERIWRSKKEEGEK